MNYRLIASGLLVGGLTTIPAFAVDRQANDDESYIELIADVSEAKTEPAPSKVTVADNVEIGRFEGSCCNDCCEGPWTPNMLGDFIGGFSFAAPPGPNIDPRAIARTLTRFKVGDNNSVLPRDRFEYSYNYFHDGFSTDADIHRNFFGGEKTFLGGQASFAIRGNLNTFTGFANTQSQSEIGNLVTNLKGILYRTATSVFTGGLAMGWPVADMPGNLSDSNYYFAPYVGYLYAPAGGRFYVQGFEQFDVPSQSQDQMVLHSDWGVGYYLRRYNRDSWITTLAPTWELHLYTPIGATGGTYQGLGYDDVLNTTLGVTAVLWDRFMLATGVALPLSTTKDYDYEFQLHLNYFFSNVNRR